MTVHQIQGSRSERRIEPPLIVQTWRQHQLLDAGFPYPLAHSLACDPRFDLHALLELVDRGCPPPLAIRILAPLPTESAP